MNSERNNNLLMSNLDLWERDKDGRLAGWDKFRFYLRFISLVFCTVSSGLVYYTIINSGKNNFILLDTGYNIGIIFGFHYFYLVISVFSIIYCFLAMFQTLAQGHQYNLPKWLIYSYITIDFLFIIIFLIATNLLLVGTPGGPIEVNEGDKFSGYMALRLVACRIGNTYSFKWQEETPGAINFPSICTISTVIGVLGYFIFVFYTLSLFLTLYLRYQWKILRS